MNHILNVIRLDKIDYMKYSVSNQIMIKKSINGNVFTIRRILYEYKSYFILKDLLKS